MYVTDSALEEFKSVRLVTKMFRLFQPMGGVFARLQNFEKTFWSLILEKALIEPYFSILCRRLHL